MKRFSPSTAEGPHSDGRLQGGRSRFAATLSPHWSNSTPSQHQKQQHFFRHKQAFFQKNDEDHSYQQYQSNNDEYPVDQIYHDPQTNEAWDPRESRNDFTQDQFEFQDNGTESMYECRDEDFVQQERIGQGYNDHTPKSTQNNSGVQRNFRPIRNSISEKIPPPSSSNNSNIELKSVNALLPDRFKSIFPFKNFNAVQSQCIESTLNSDVNLVISAPTGSGKTVIMELAIIRLLMLKGGSNYKVIYVAPTKSLCHERAQDWKAKFRVLGISCNELTGDVDYKNLHEIQQSNIIVTTPEKWDSMTRSWRDYKSLMTMIRLFLIDEVHMIQEDRGATLEVVVSRMKSANMETVRANGMSMGPDDLKLRLLAISATIAIWLRDVRDNSPAVVKVFGEEYRPVPIQREIIAIPSKGNSYTFDSNLDFKLMDTVLKFNSGKPAIVFCATRKATVNSASRLAKEAGEISGVKFGQNHPFVGSSRQYQMLKELAKKLSDKKLVECVMSGIAFHNAGLNFDERRAIEDGFISGTIQLICSTCTLAVGVNLPAHLVIIKGTTTYTPKEAEYSELDILQMIGRAGRPQFDDSAVAVIMTSSDKKHKYEQLISGGEILESRLHENLIEHLNAEIVLQSFNNVDRAIDWLKSSFLYVRIKKNPQKYKLSSSNNNRASSLEEICIHDLDLLRENSLLEMKSDNKTFISTEYGVTLAKYYLKFQTVVNFIKLKPKASPRDVFECIVKSEELAQIRFHSDKQILNTMNKAFGIRFPLKDRVKGVDDKISIVIQTSFAAIAFPEKTNFALDLVYMLKHMNRVGRGMLEVLEKKGDAITLRSGIDIVQSINAKSWADSHASLRQIEGIGPANSGNLFQNRISTIQQLEATEERRIEVITNRNPPFGNKVKEAIRRLPKFKINDSNHYKRTVEVFVVVSLPNAANVTGCKALEAIFLSSSGSSIHYIRHWKLIELVKETNFSFDVPITTLNQRIFNSIISLNSVGLDVNCDIAVDTSCMKLLAQPVVLPRLKKSPKRPQSSPPPGEEDYFKNDAIEWEAVDWDSFDKAANIKSVPPAQAKPNPKPSARSVGDNVPCNHLCKDKLRCKHECCKAGIPVKRAAKRRKAATSVLSSDDDTNAPDVLIAQAPTKPQIYDNLEHEFMSEDDDPLLKSIFETAKIKKEHPKTIQDINNLHKNSTMSNPHLKIIRQLPTSEISTAPKFNDELSNLYSHKAIRPALHKSIQPLQTRANISSFFDNSSDSDFESSPLKRKPLLIKKEALIQPDIRMTELSKINKLHKYTTSSSVKKISSITNQDRKSENENIHGNQKPLKFLASPEDKSEHFELPKIASMHNQDVQSALFTEESLESPSAQPTPVFLMDQSTDDQSGQSEADTPAPAAPSAGMQSQLQNLKSFLSMCNVDE